MGQNVMGSAADPQQGMVAPRKGMAAVYQVQGDYAKALEFYNKPINDKPE